MEWFSQNKIRITVHYINILLIFYILSICLEIKDINYIYVTIIFLISSLIYWFFSYVIRKWLYRIIIYAVGTFIAAASIYVNLNIVVDYVYKYIIGSIYTINNDVSQGMNTSFGLYIPLMLVVVPTIVFITFFLYTKGLRNSIMFVVLVQVLFFLVFAVL